MKRQKATMDRMKDAREKMTAVSFIDLGLGLGNKAMMIAPSTGRKIMAVR